MSERTVTPHATLLVIEREVREAARRKSIWALVGLVLLGSTAMVVLPGVIDGDDSATVMIVGDDTIGITSALEDVGDPDIEVEAGASRDAAVEAIESDEVDLAVVLGDPPVLAVEDEDDSLVTIVREVVGNRVAATRFAEVDIDPDAVAQVFADSVPTVEPVDVERGGREAAAFGITLVLYLLTVVLTSQIASSVAIEKSNRVSEVLLAIVPARSLLVGKVLGVGCIGLVTLIAGAAPVVVRLVIGGDLPERLGQTLAVSAVWFVGGLALYLTIAGAAGALVSRQEEVGAIITPLTMLLVAGYLVAITAAESTLGAILGYVPLTSPLVQPFRTAVGAGSPLEYVISLAILLVTLAIVARVAATVYRRAIVRTGRRLKLRDVLSPPNG